MKVSIFTTLFYVFLMSHFLSAVSPGKMVITGFKGTSPDDPQVIALKERIDAEKIGGIILFKRNILDKDQLVNLVQYLTKDASIFVAIDHEGGIVNRLTDSSFNLKTPSPERFCKLNPSQQNKIASTIATNLSELGINLNLGGVVDIAPLIYPSSICRYKRCFSSDQSQITTCNQVLFNAHKQENIFFSLKHFPGHGSTPIDSHYYLPDITKHHSDYDYMPYHKLLKNNSSPYMMVMIGHLMIKDIDPNLPASLSKKHIDILKKKLNYNGLVITDDLNMGALYKVSRNKSVIARKAVLAGNDLLLFEYLTLNEIDDIYNTLTKKTNQSEEFLANVNKSSIKIEGNLSLNDR